MQYTALKFDDFYLFFFPLSSASRSYFHMGSMVSFGNRRLNQPINRPVSSTESIVPIPIVDTVPVAIRSMARAMATYIASATIFMFESFFHSIHGAAGHLATLIHFAVLDGKHAFTEFGRDAKSGRYPHPDNGARSSGYHCGCNANNVSCPNRCSKCSCQCRKRGNITISLFCPGFFA